MSAAAHLCGLSDVLEVVAPPSASRIRELAVATEGYALVEPDLPIGKLTLPRDPIDRAVLAIITRGAPRALMLVRGDKPKLAKVKEERALDLWIALRAATTRSGSALFEAAMAVLAERGEAVHGKQLLREARARRGGASTKDGAELGKAIVRAWSDGLLELRQVNELLSQLGQLRSPSASD